MNLYQVESFPKRVQHKEIKYNESNIFEFSVSVSDQGTMSTIGAFSLKFCVWLYHVVRTNDAILAPLLWSGNSGFVEM